MKNLPWICIGLMATFITGDCLICHSCRGSFMGKCWRPSTVMCNDSQSSCYYGKMFFNMTRLKILESRGCLASSLCNQTQTGTLLTAGYTITRTCCNTDCCNGATSVRLPFAAALGAALTAVWSPWAL